LTPGTGTSTAAEVTTSSPGGNKGYAHHRSQNQDAPLASLGARCSRERLSNGCKQMAHTHHGCATCLRPSANPAQVPPSSCSCGFGGDCGGGALANGPLYDSEGPRQAQPASARTRIPRRSRPEALAAARGAVELATGGRASLDAPGGAGLLMSYLLVP
jgi:hypothetical protein